jgi:hypothetical protein
LGSEIGRRYGHPSGEVKGAGILFDESKEFAARLFVVVRGTPMIRKQTKIRLQLYAHYLCRSLPALFSRRKRLHI